MNATAIAPRWIVRRRFFDRPIAPAKQISATKGRTQASFWRMSTPPWTSARVWDWTSTNSWRSAGSVTLSAIVMPLASSRCFTFSKICATLIAMVPFAVDTRDPPPVSTATTFGWAFLFAFSQSVWNRSDSKRRSAAALMAVRIPFAMGSARKLARAGSASAIFLLHVDACIDAVGEPVGECLLHHRLRRERTDGRHVVVGVEQRVADPNCAQRDGNQQATDDQQDRADDPAPARRLRLRLCLVHVRLRVDRVRHVRRVRHGFPHIAFRRDTGHAVVGEGRGRRRPSRTTYRPHSTRSPPPGHHPNRVNDRTSKANGGVEPGGGTPGPGGSGTPRAVRARLPVVFVRPGSGRV